MAKHTPGPWLLSYSEEGGGYHEIEAPANGVRNVAGDFGRVACVRHCKQADAYLIAAAPDLLEALKKCAAYIQTQMVEHGLDMDYGDTNTLNTALFAIAKAEARNA